jgi:hypothetical protein
MRMPRNTELQQKSMHTYEVRTRRDKRGVDLISDALPFGRLWYDGPNATRDSSESGEFTFITPKPMFSHRQFR